ncbi:hypothetical protein [Cesiribacter sp. SM1]|uniref:hypothetical protein n=1 Tax=Cesiribacter sp. SM1 TaxID=2861196 RepID=UPI001CD39DF7|nr:hypothetical protein [Cesiribacter sp. SM1]
MFKYLRGRACRSKTFSSIGLLGLACVIVSLFLAAAPAEPSTNPIALQPESLPIIPKEFFITEVLDERENQKAVAWLLPVAQTLNPAAKAQPVDLQGGGQALKQFIHQSLPVNKKLRPVVVRIHDFKVTEKAGSEGRVEGRVQLSMSFDLLRDGEYVYLTDYEGAVRYSRSPGQHTVVEPALRRSLASGLKFLNEWMDTEATKNEKLALGVKVFFTDYVQHNKADTVFYDPARPLRWDDFVGKPVGSRYAAQVFPSFGYGGPSAVVDGYIHLNLNMKVFVLKENSWVRAGANNDYALNHEQRHFDIVKLVVERFKNRITSKQLPVVDYGGIIAYEYIESFREMNRLQDQYDSETQHGLNNSAQERWNARIEKELREMGVK